MRNSNVSSPFRSIVNDFSSLAHDRSSDAAEERREWALECPECGGELAFDKLDPEDKGHCTYCQRRGE